MKKGQIAMYLVIIVVLIMLIGVGYMIVSRQENNVQVQHFDLDTSSVQEFVSGCLEKASYNAISTSAMQGGYIPLPENRIIMDNIKTSIVLSEEGLFLPKQSAIEGMIEQEIAKQVSMCLNGFSVFDNMNITHKPPKVNIRFDTVKVAVEMDMSTLITSFGKQGRINTYSVSVPTLFYHDLMIISDLIEDMGSRRSWVNLNKLYGTGMKVQIIPVDKETAVISLIEKKGLDGDDLVWLLGIKIDQLDDPYFEIDSKYNLKQGKEFSHYLNPNQEIVFYDDTAMFDINNNWINFTPTVTGEFNITIRGVSLNGQELIKKSRLTINE